MGRRNRSTEEPPVDTGPLYPDDGPDGEGEDPDELLRMSGVEDRHDPAGYDNGLQSDAGADMAAHYNSAHRTDLSGYEAPPIGAGYNAPPVLGGDPGLAGVGMGLQPQPITGRPTTPPIWAHAHLFPAAPQLRCWKLQNGNPHLVGVIDSKASEEEFIRFFIDSMPAPGEGSATFAIRPINAQGIEVREEIVLPPISEFNTTLKQVRAARAGAAAAAAGNNPMPAPDYSGVNRVQEQLLNMFMVTTQNAQAAAQREREHAQKMQADVATQTVELSQRGAMATEAIAERMMKSDADRTTAMLAIERQRGDDTAKREAERNAQINLTMQGMFTQMQTLSMQAQERERQAYEQRMREDDDRRRRDRDDADRRLQAERVEAETKRERERLEAEERRERERREWEQKFQQTTAEQQARWQRENADAERREREREAERQRQHDLRMKEMDASATRDREHAERMAALNNRDRKDESIEGLLEKGGKIATMFGIKLQDIPDMLRGGDEDKPADPNAWTPLIQVIAPALTEAVRTFGGVVQAGMQMRMGQQIGGYPPSGGQVQMLPGQPPVFAQPPAIAQQQQAAAPTTPGATPEAVPVVAVPGPQSSLPLTTQKAARNAIRDLVKSLRTSGQDKWQEVIGFAIGGEQAIYHYCKEVTIRAALIEGGADEALITALYNHPAATLIPNDVPRG